MSCVIGLGLLIGLGALLSSESDEPSKQQSSGKADGRDDHEKKAEVKNEESQIVATAPPSERTRELPIYTIQLATTGDLERAKADRDRIRSAFRTLGLDTNFYIFHRPEPERNANYHVVLGGNFSSFARAKEALDFARDAGALNEGGERVLYFDSFCVNISRPSVEYYYCDKP